MKGISMRYKDIECSACSKKFDDNSDVVVCPVCGAPHHRECWIAAGKCAHEAEHASGYHWEFPQIPIENDEDKKTTDEPEQIIGDFFENGEGVVMCQNCHAPNYSNDMYCRVCHAPLKGNAADAGKSEGNGFGGNFDGTNDSRDGANARFDVNEEMLFDSFNRYGGLNPDSTIDDIPVREYAAFVGGKTPGRIVRKVATLERYGRTVVPIFGGVFGVVWFFYRKMTKVGAVISAIMLTLCLAAGLLQITDAYKDMIKESAALTAQLSDGTISVSDMRDRIVEIQEEYFSAGRTDAERTREKVSEVLYALVFYSVPVIGFFCGISIYRTDVRKKILRAREQCSDMPSYMNELQLRGGTSAGLALVGILVYGAATFFYSYLPMIIVMVTQ